MPKTQAYGHGGSYEACPLFCDPGDAFCCKSAEQQREVAELVRQGPDLAEHGVVRWRRIDLSRVIEQGFAPGATRLRRPFSPSAL
jgi:hypothetical protein